MIAFVFPQRKKLGKFTKIDFTINASNVIIILISKWKTINEWKLKINSFQRTISSQQIFQVIVIIL